MQGIQRVASLFDLDPEAGRGDAERIAALRDYGRAAARMLRSAPRRLTPEQRRTAELLRSAAGTSGPSLSRRNLPPRFAELSGEQLFRSSGEHPEVAEFAEEYARFSVLCANWKILFDSDTDGPFLAEDGDWSAEDGGWLRFPPPTAAQVRRRLQQPAFAELGVRGRDAVQRFAHAERLIVEAAVRRSPRFGVLLYYLRYLRRDAQLNPRLPAGPLRGEDAEAALLARNFDALLEGVEVGPDDVERVARQMEALRASTQRVAARILWRTTVLAADRSGCSEERRATLARLRELRAHLFADERRGAPILILVDGAYRKDTIWKAARRAARGAELRVALPRDDWAEGGVRAEIEYSRRVVDWRAERGTRFVVLHAVRAARAQGAEGAEGAARAEDAQGVEGVGGVDGVDGGGETAR